MEDFGMFEKVFNKKSAMNLAELIIVFTIMGIVATMTIMAAKPTEKSLKYAYTQAFNVLGTAFYNSSINLPAGLDNNFIDGSFPTSYRNFCLMLTDYINTSTNRCDSVSDSNVVNINVAAPNLEGDPHFIASNGAWYWIGRIGNNGFQLARLQDSSASATQQSVRYHIVIVDLNGSLGPNTTDWSQNRAADRVAFIVTEEADVIPIGHPEIDSRYLTAKVVYNAMTGVEADDQSTSRTMTYYEAKRHAWANALGTDVTSNIYRSSEELNSYTFYEGAEGLVNNGTGSQVINRNTAFYLDYLGADLRTYRTTINHDALCNRSEADPALDPTACYVKITEYN